MTFSKIMAISPAELLEKEFAIYSINLMSIENAQF